MAPRLELQALLESLLGTPNVYFQPPSSSQMEYPCFVYNRDRVETEHADNRPYHKKSRYQITIIGEDPDEVAEISGRVGDLPTASFDRSFVADNLNHDVLTLFF